MGRGRPSKSAAPKHEKSERTSGASTSQRIELPQRKSPRLVQSKINTTLLGRNNVGGNRAAKRGSKLSSSSSVEEVPVPADKSKKMKRRQSQSQTKEEMLKELIAFDLDSAFGPARGVSRLERLQRAVEFGLFAEEDIKMQRLRAHLECLLADGVEDAQLCLWDHPTLYASYVNSDRS